ncbi:hypothetical protein SUDANB176_00384 [Streptomyces sp. enrichment culture]|uniref:hypothetical protein n=1 Tax=Streptomyces sp. enrichment culture TaxID=1795815 RepID=UPI003F579BAD
MSGWVEEPQERERWVPDPLVGRVPSRAAADLHEMARRERSVVKVNWSGDPEVPAWGLSTGTERRGDRLVTTALLVGPGAAADPYGFEPIIQWCGVREPETNPGAWPVKADKGRPRWDWTPLEGVGPLRFGMSPQQVVDALDGEGPAARRGRYSYGPSWERLGQRQPYRDRFDRAGVTAHYGDHQGHPGLAGVTVHGRTGPQVTFAGTPLIGMVPSAVAAALARHIHEDDLVCSGGGDPGSYALGLWMRATRVRDTLVSEARFCVSGWEDED